MNIDANKIIEKYRNQLDQLQYENFILQAQVELLQAKSKEADNDAKSDENSSATEN